MREFHYRWVWWWRVCQAKTETDIFPSYGETRFQRAFDAFFKRISWIRSQNVFNSQGQVLTIRTWLSYITVFKLKTLNPLKAPPKTPHLVALGLGEGGEDKKVKKYMKQKIIKNGVTLKPGFHIALFFFELAKFYLNWNTLKIFPSDQTSDLNIWLTVSETQFILNFYIVLLRNRF